MLNEEWTQRWVMYWKKQFFANKFTAEQMHYFMTIMFRDQFDASAQRFGDVKRTIQYDPETGKVGVVIAVESNEEQLEKMLRNIVLFNDTPFHKSKYLEEMD